MVPKKSDSFLPLCLFKEFSDMIFKEVVIIERLAFQFSIKKQQICSNIYQGFEN